MANSIGTIRGTIKIDYDGAGVVKAQQDIGKTEASSTKAKAAADKLGTGLLAAGGLVAAGFGVAVKKAADFEQGLSDIKAVSGATTAQMEQIRAKALQLGKDTQFSASEAADAIDELAKAGVPLPDILNGAADAAVALAAAGGIGLPEAATIASNAMNQFGLSAKQLPGIADKIAGAANASAIDVSDFGHSLSQSGAVAHLVGLSFDDLSVAIAEMGNAGIKGSDAGTSLKTFLTNLVPQTDVARAEMERLGLITIDYGKAAQFLANNGIKPLNNSHNELIYSLQKYAASTVDSKIGTQKANKAFQQITTQAGLMDSAFFKSNGSLESFGVIQQRLQDSLKGMSKEQKIAALQTLFGSDAIRAASIAADNGQSGFNKLAGAIGKVKAADVAKTKMDNLKGSFEQFKGSVETAAIQVGSVLLPVLKQIVDTANNIVGAFVGLSSGTQETILKVVGITGALLGMAGAFIKIISFIEKFKAAVVALKAYELGAKASAIATRVWAVAQGIFNAIMAINPVILVVAAIAALVAIIILAYKHSERFRAIVQSVWTFIKTFVTAAINGVVAAFHAFVNFIVGVFSPIFNTIRTVVQAVIGFVVNYIRTELAFLRAIWQAVWGALAPILIPIFNLIKSIVQAFWSVITAIFAVARTVIVAIFRAMFAVALSVIRPALAVMRALFAVTWNAIKAATQVAWQLIKNYVITPLVALYTAAVARVRAVLAVVSAVWNTIKARTAAVWSAIRAAVSAAINAVYSVVAPKIRATQSVITGTWNIIKSVTSAAWNVVKSVVSSGVHAVVSIINGIRAMVDKVRSFFNQLKAAANGGVGSLISFVATIPRRILGAIGNLGGLLFSKGQSIVQGLINGIRSLAGSVVSALVGLLPGPLKKFAGKLGIASPSKLFHSWGEFVVKGFVNGIKAMQSTLDSTMSSVTDVAVRPVVSGTRGIVTGSGTLSRPLNSTTTISTNPVVNIQPGAVVVNGPAGASPGMVAQMTVSRLAYGLSTGAIPVGSTR